MEFNKIKKFGDFPKIQEDVETSGSMKTNQDCVDEILAYLQKVKANNIKVEGDFSVSFSMRGLSFEIYIEDEETMHYSVTSVVGQEDNFGQRFSDRNTEYGDLAYFEDFMMGIVDGYYDYIKQIWSKFDELKQKHNFEKIKSLAALYFGLLED